MITLTTLDRTIFELIRLKTVAFGYLPDWRSISGVSLADKQNNYEVAKIAIRDDNKQIIEVFSVSGQKAKESKSLCKIVIDRKGLSQGNLGAFGIRTFVENQSGNFDLYQLPHKSMDVNYEIRLLANKVEYERIMEGIIFETFLYSPIFRAVDWANGWTFTKELIEIEVNGSSDLSDEDFVEKLITLTVKDVWLSGLETQEIIRSAVPLTTVEFSTFVAGVETETTTVTDN